MAARNSVVENRGGKDCVSLMHSLEDQNSLTDTKNTKWHSCKVIFAVLFSVTALTVTLVSVVMVMYRMADMNRQILELREQCVLKDSLPPEYLRHGGHSKKGEVVIDIVGEASGENSYGPTASGYKPAELWDPEESDYDDDYYDDEVDLEQDSSDARERRGAAQGSGRNRRNRGNSGRSFSCNLAVKDNVMNFKGSNKDKCKRKLKAFIKDMIKEQAEVVVNAKVPTIVEETMDNDLSLAPIHLMGNITVDPTDLNWLHEDQTRSKNIADKNGKMYYQGFVPNNETMAFWSMAEWLKNNNKTKRTYTFDQQKGTITIKQAGLYFIYAQVTFHDTIAHMGYHVKNNPANDRSNPVNILSCVTGVDALAEGAGEPQDTAKFKSCASTGLTRLEEGDSIHMESTSRSLKIITNQSGFTNWGVIKVQ